MMALYLAASVAATATLAWVVARSCRRLDRRVAEFREEVEENPGAYADPYRAFAQLYADDQFERRRDAPRRRSRGG
ncbi:MAG: hypothetical protein IT208_03365 [Chthonomonadales bacterium]|nr:hypothetical protein [Chthonomonadales bacterium]